MPSDPSSLLRIARFLPLLFVGIGIWLVVSGIRRYLAYRRFLARAVHVPGVVTGHDAVQQHSSDSGTTTYWYPVLRFSTKDGRLVDTLSMAGRQLRRPPVGEQVEVLYDPLDPLRAGLPGARGTLASLTQVFVGLVFIPVGLIGFGIFSVVSSSLP